MAKPTIAFPTERLLLARYSKVRVAQITALWDSGLHFNLPLYASAEDIAISLNSPSEFRFLKPLTDNGIEGSAWLSSSQDDSTELLLDVASSEKAGQRAILNPPLKSRYTCWPDEHS